MNKDFQYKKQSPRDTETYLVTIKTHVNEVTEGEVNYERITTETYHTPIDKEALDINQHVGKAQKVSEEFIWVIEHNIIGWTLVSPMHRTELEAKFQSARQVKQFQKRVQKTEKEATENHLDNNEAPYTSEKKSHIPSSFDNKVESHD